ncbi:MAG: hypothetical protein IJJ23_04265 [Clostridia bacterium]|nr:hypothetical protein [Clostridia bacterium]
MSGVQREYMDRLFCFIFGSEEHKDWTLSLYNAVNGTSYENPDDIQITTLTEVVYMGMHNDVAFLITDEINMFEQQSTFNPNMPLRLMQYTSNIYKKLITFWQKNKYGKTLIRLPVPKLVVFYNGTKDEPDERILSLSDAFAEEKRDDADITVRVRMININTGKSPDIVSACKPLVEYTWLVGRVRDCEKTMELDTAVDIALDEMPESFLIKTYLEANRLEVKKMLLTEYNEAKTMEMFKEEGREEGQSRLSALIARLISQGRISDIEKVVSDSAFRDRMYEEFSKS